VRASGLVKLLIKIAQQLQHGRDGGVCMIFLKVYLKNKMEFFVIDLYKQKHPFLAWVMFTFLVNIKIYSNYKTV
jgi:hypothetical protein